jgi:hypothetical protein
LQRLLPKIVGKQKNYYVDDYQRVIHIWRSPRPNICSYRQQKHILVFIKISRNLTIGMVF